MSDWELLRRYVDDNSQPSFTRLVDRHMNLVYWTCRRDLNDAQLAEDACQMVFILLARKASGMRRGVRIAGWLFSAARLVSRNMRRREATRRRHEEQVASTVEQSLAVRHSWSDVEPAINSALDSLNAFDREAVLLRFFGGMSFHEVAAEIGTSEEAARKRVARALEKLRRRLSQPEALTVTSLGILLTEHADNTAPLELRGSILRHIEQALPAHASVSAVRFHVPAIKKGATILMHATTRKAVISFAAVALLGAGIAIPLSVWNTGRASTVADRIAYVGLTPSGSASAKLPVPAVDAIDSAYRMASTPAHFDDMGCVPGYAASGCVVQVADGNTLTSDLATAISKHFFQMVPRELDDVSVSETLQSLQSTTGGAMAVVDCKVEGAACMDEILYGSEREKKGARITFDPTFQDEWQLVNGSWLNVKRTWLAPSNRALKLYPLEDAPGAYRSRP